ncbi:hypothetical protein Q0N35_12855 [Priestia koreensis]
MNPQALTSIFGAMPRFELAELLNVQVVCISVNRAILQWPLLLAYF